LPKNKLPYTKSDINKVIDSLLHPLMKDHSWLVFVDGLLHALNEQDPKQSLEKFIKYNIKPLIEELNRQVERQAKKALK